MLYYGFKRLPESCNILASGRCDARLAAASALDELGTLADVGSGVASGLNQVRGVHKHQLRLS